MQIFNSITDLPLNHDIGLTIGNFDGVHLGHQKLLQTINDTCQKQGLIMVVMTFVPHPLTILRNQESFLLNTYEERRELLKAAGVKYLIEIAFNRDFSTLSPSSFLDDYILSSSLVKQLFLGYDFAFGANKKGDHDFVKEYMKGRGIQVAIQGEEKKDLEAYSSGLARDYLKRGETLEAASVLGRPFYCSGRIIKGAGRGKQIGFPTANLEIDSARLIPQRGVYSTVTTYKGADYISITNVGHNPTFNDGQKVHVETNIFDFDSDIYGEVVKVTFLEKIRDERKFSSVNDLIDQIKKDVQVRRDLHKVEK